MVIRPYRHEEARYEAISIKVFAGQPFQAALDMAGWKACHICKYNI